MAERRMFAKTIIDSDAFLDMPLSAQSLYFHLSMRADDDGFINNPRKIQRMIGASDDDLKLLIMKNFIIPFESGIVVIKHWKIHNYIRGDRKKETVYPEEMAMLEEKENGAYTFRSDIPVLEVEQKECETPRQKAYRESSLPYSFEYKIKNAFYGKICPICGCTMSTNVDECGVGSNNRIPTIQHNVPISKGGKHELGNISVICKQCNVTIKDTETGELNAGEVVEVWEKLTKADKCPSSDCQVPVKSQHRLGKDRLGKESIRESVDFSQIVDLYHSICVSYPRIKTLSDARKKTIKARLNLYTLDDFETMFKKAEASDFLRGANSKNWTATFDWMIKDANMVKILDGNYDNTKPKSQASSGSEPYFKDNLMNILTGNM